MSTLCRALYCTVDESRLLPLPLPSVARTVLLLAFVLEGFGVFADVVLVANALHTYLSRLKYENNSDEAVK
jgi:hypothetical protein